MMYPKRILDGTPKIHLVGFSFHWYFCRLVNVLSRSAMRSLAVLDLTTTSST